MSSSGALAINDFSGTYKRYALGVLTLVYTMNFLDRGLMSLLLQPIKEDLHLSDTQLGFLTGIAFGLFYATLGLPIARWADRGNRVNLTAIAIGLWGLTVMACLFVTNFVQLMCARMAAAVGEAGCMPPTYSLVGDYFPSAAERPRAMAVYMLAGPAASLASYIVGGWLNELYGWRLTFFVMGLPALAIAALVKMSLREPRLQFRGTPIEASPSVGFTHVVRALWRQPSARHLSIALVLLFFMGYGIGPWYAAFLIRSHGMTTAQLGLSLGLIFGITGIVGTLLGGYVTSRWLAGNERLQMRVCSVTIGLLFPGLVAFLTVPKATHALFALALLSIVWALCFGPVYALMQRLVPDAMRASALAVLMLFSNLLGMGLGPQIVGILSDALAPALGGDSLRYAMIILSTVALWAACHFRAVARTVNDDLARIHG